MWTTLVHGFSNYLTCGQDALSSDSTPMATSILSHQSSRLFSRACATPGPPSTAVILRRHLPPPPKPRKLTFNVKGNNRFKWVIQSSLAEQSPPKTFDMQQLVEFLYDDLTHLFDDQGIDKTAYDERVSFRDPITKHDTLSGYLFNIALLKTIFKPLFQLHWVKPVGFKFNFTLILSSSLFRRICSVGLMELL